MTALFDLLDEREINGTIFYMLENYEQELLLYVSGSKHSNI